jgi:outer membrane protein assembly factor BamB
VRRNGKFLDTGFVLAFIVSPILLVLAMPAMALDWQQFQKDEVNSGWTNDSAPIQYVDLAHEKVWNVSTQAGSGCGIDTVPIVVGDYVYVVATSKLFKFNKATVNEVWNATIDTTAGFQLSTPAYGNGRGTGTETIFVANNHGGLYAINATSGAKRWNVTVCAGNKQLNTPVTYYNNSDIELIFLGDWNGDKKYYCYNVTANATTTNNTKVWDRASTSTGGYYWAGAAVIGNHLVYGDDKSNVTCVYAKNGTFADDVNVSALWDNFNAKEIRSSITWNETGETPNYGHIYFTSKGGYCYALGFNKSTGEFNTSDKWRNNIGYSTSTPAVYNGRVYVGQGPFGNNGKLYCLYESSGNEVWNFTPNGGVQSSPALSIQGSDVYIYFTTNCQNGRAYCVRDKKSDNTPEERWYYETEQAGTSGGYILQGVAISDGRVFFGNDGGYIYGIKNVTKKTERVHVYNFDSGAGTDKWAFKYQNNSKPPTTCDVPSEEFNATEYTNIKADDDSSTFNQTDTADYYATHRFNISIEEYVANVTEMRVNWKGKGLHGNTSSDHNGSYLYIWNGTAYKELDHQTDVPSDTEYSLHGKITTGISDYVSSSGSGKNVTILVMAKNAHDGTDASKLWTNYVELRVHTNVSRYDFRTGAGTDKWAFRNETSATLSVSEPNIEFTTAQYYKINRSDNTRQEDQTSQNGYYAAHRFNISILEDTSVIRKINVTWEGIGDHQTSTDGAKLYIYNFTSTAYEQLASTTESTEQTLTGEKTSSISSYINSGNVTVLVNQTSAQTEELGEKKYSRIWTDYVKLELHIGA